MRNDPIPARARPNAPRAHSGCRPRAPRAGAGDDVAARVGARVTAALPRARQGGPVTFALPGDMRLVFGCALVMGFA